MGELQIPFADVVKTSRLSKQNQSIMVLDRNIFEEDLIIMSGSPSAGNASFAGLLARSTALPMLLSRLIGLFRRQDSLDGLKALTDAQLRDIGIERHRIGPSLEGDRARWRSW